MHHPSRLAALCAVSWLAGACGTTKTLAPGNASGNAADCTVENASNSKTVVVSDYAFTPSCIAVTQGTEVSFANAGADDHTVSSAPGQPETFDLTGLSPQTTVTHTFQTAGKYSVVCDFHPSMQLTVIVVGS
jgi:plastocyanin